MGIAPLSALTFAMPPVAIIAGPPPKAPSPKTVQPSNLTPGANPEAEASRSKARAQSTPPPQMTMEGKGEGKGMLPKEVLEKLPRKKNVYQETVAKRVENFMAPLDIMYDPGQLKEEYFSIHAMADTHSMVPIV